MDTLRELRLWHWRKVLSYRKTAERYEADQQAWNAKHHPPHTNNYSANKAKNAHKIANRHLGAVQALNEVVSGTAEQDAAKKMAAP